MSIEETPAAEAHAFSRRNSLRGATDHLHRDLDRIVAGFRLGAWNEGGTGVTVAELE